MDQNTIKAIPSGANNLPSIPERKNNGRNAYEAKLIQTFPKDFIVTGAWGEAMRQIGNAVPVKLSEVIAKHLFRLLNE